MFETFGANLNMKGYLPANVYLTLERSIIFNKQININQPKFYGHYFNCELSQELPLWVGLTVPSFLVTRPGNSLWLVSALLQHVAHTNAHLTHSGPLNIREPVME